MWDEIFRICQTQEPIEEDCECERAEQVISIGIKLTRGLELSITPKIHGIEVLDRGWSTTIRLGQTSTQDSKHRHTKDMKTLAAARSSIDDGGVSMAVSESSIVEL